MIVLSSVLDFRIESFKFLDRFEFDWLICLIREKKKKYIGYTRHILLRGNQIEIYIFGVKVVDKIINTWPELISDNNK